MGDIFFTSDTHFGHRNIIMGCNRPFESVEEMNSIMIKEWNRKVKPKDTIYHLGDVSFLSPQATIHILKQLNGRKILIKGNHDYKVPQAVMAEWDEVHHLKQIKIDNHTIVMCHFPMLRWNKSHYGSWMLCGHSHGHIPFDFKVKRLDVGVDCHDFKPLSFEEVRSIMLDKPDFRYKVQYEHYDPNFQREVKKDASI